MRYILYARKSSEEKTRQVQSIDDQISALQPIIQEDGRIVTHTLTESRSAKAPGRPVFNEMLNLIQRGQADAILCWHINRLTRNPVDSGTIRWMLQQGIIKEIVTPHRVYRPEDNALISAVESAMGEQFLVELIQSSRRGMLSKVEKGWFPGKVPQGYRNDIVAHTILRDSERWDLVRRAWSEFLTGRFSVPMIAEKMTEWGYRSPRSGTGMARNTLYNIFSNPFYTGVFEFEKQIYPGNHPPMVTHEEFAEVQQLLGHGTVKPRRTKREFVFNGLIVCGHCGRAVCGDRKRKLIKDTNEERIYTYYACSRGSRCNKHRLREDVIEEQMAQRLEEITLPQEYLDYARGVSLRWRQEERQAEEEVRASQAQALADTEQQMDELVRLRTRGLIEEEEFTRLRDQLKGEKLSVLANAEKTSLAIERSLYAAVNLAEFCVNAEQVFHKGSVADRGQVARILGVSYMLTDGKLVIEESGLLGLVRAHKKNALSLIGSLEPVEISFESDKETESAALSKRWGGLRSRSRIKVTGMNDHLPMGTLDPETRLFLAVEAERLAEEVRAIEELVLPGYPELVAYKGLLPDLLSAAARGGLRFPPTDPSPLLSSRVDVAN